MLARRAFSLLYSLCTCLINFTFIIIIIIRNSNSKYKIKYKITVIALNLRHASTHDSTHARHKRPPWYRAVCTVALLGLGCPPPPPNTNPIQWQCVLCMTRTM
jgi:hypothetical protein